VDGGSRRVAGLQIPVDTRGGPSWEPFLVVRRPSRRALAGSLLGPVVASSNVSNSSSTYLGSFHSSRFSRERQRAPHGRRRGRTRNQASSDGSDARFSARASRSNKTCSVRATLWKRSADLGSRSGSPASLLVSARSLPMPPQSLRRSAARVRLWAADGSASSCSIRQPATNPAARLWYVATHLRASRDLPAPSPREEYSSLNPPYAH